MTRRRLPKPQVRKLVIKVTSGRLRYALLIHGVVVERGDKSIVASFPEGAFRKAKKLIARTQPHEVSLQHAQQKSCQLSLKAQDCMKSISKACKKNQIEVKFCLHGGRLLNVELVDPGVDLSTIS